MNPGEFGPIYEKETNPDFEVQNEERYNMLDKQMEIYTAEEIGEFWLETSRRELANLNSMGNLVLQRHQCHGHALCERRYALEETPCSHLGKETRDGSRLLGL